MTETATALSSAATRVAPVPLIPREALFGNPTRAGGQSSPDGQWLAWMAPHEGVMNVWLAPADDPAAARRMTSATERPIPTYFFAPDSRSLLYIQDKAGDENYLAYQVDVASGEERCLTPFENTRVRLMGASHAIKDKILVGQSYGDWATRGWVAALDAKTGEEVWRFYTVPEPGQPGSETWLCDQSGNPDCWKTGGAAAWVTGSYDEASNTTYWGTGNPVPMYDPEYRPGDNLYSNSTVALDADTGELKWHFQYTPGDYMDYDEVGAQLLVDAKVDGEDRKVLAHFGRNGIFYTLDRTNGSFIAANPYVSKLNWTKGIDPKTGKPVEYDASKPLQVYANGTMRRGGETVNTCPNIQGGMNFWPPAVDSSTNIAYGAGIEGCSDLTVEQKAPEDVAPGATTFAGGAAAASGAQTGSIFAFDVTTGKQVASI